jgi:V8-like Glu-specific endopeptidase
MRRTVLALTLVLSALAAWAGPRPLPRAHGQAVLPAASVETVTLPPLDLVRLQAEDAADAGQAVPYRIGVAREVGASLRAGTLEALPGGAALWRLAVASPGAPWMSVTLAGLAPLPGLEVRFHDPAGAVVLGPVAAERIAPSGVLASPVVPGDTLVVEVFVPSGPLPDLAVASAVTGYKAFGPARGAGACNIDINCPEGAEWQSDKRAVAHIVFGGYVCTGTLLNNARGDCRNYFLTANHCIHNDSTAQATVFYWNYEWTGCGTGEFLYEDWQSGSTLRAMNPQSDFTLLELNTPPDPAFNVYYAGWNAGADAADGAVGIHHPSGDVKKISFEYDRLVSAGGGNFWRTPNWDLGVTEGGSSGSGLWNLQHEVVGQLYGGASACGNPKSQMWDEYGKLAVSWSNGTTVSTRLKDWLDPDGTGALALGGRDSDTCGASSHRRPVERP